MNAAFVWAQDKETEYGIHNETHVSYGAIRKVIRELDKLPPHMHQTIVSRGGGVEVFTGLFVTDHPDLKDQQGMPLEPGLNMTDAAAVSYQGRSYININQWNASTSGNVILHEHGHTYDYHCGHLSWRAEWRAIYGSSPWYNQQPVEAFAESFAHYFDSTSTRRELPDPIRAYFEKLERRGCTAVG